MIRKISFIICYLLFVICSVKADWVQVNNGLTQLNINALTATGNYIFAGTQVGGGVFVTTNNGNNWTLTSLQTTTIALASSSSYIYAGYQNGLGYSSNYGATWNGGSLNHWVNTILANGNYVYAGCFYPTNSTDRGVWISSNYGANWTQTTLNNINIYALTLSGNYLFATGYTNGIGSGVYLSTNNGGNWASCLSFSGSALASNGNNIYLGANGVYKSTNYGANWTQTLSNQSIHAIVLYGSNVFAAGSIFVSTDNGTNWTIRTEGMGNLYVNSLCVLNDFLFAGTDGNGVFRRPLSELVGIETISQTVPKGYDLKQNYPNPFNIQTIIEMSIPKRDNYTLDIVDILGRKVDIAYEGFLNVGSYKINYNADKLASGVYFYTLKSNNYINTKKFVLIK